jgi:hypothetical protein
MHVSRLRQDQHRALAFLHRAGSIGQIAEQQHVLTPLFGESGISLKRIGVREASTFPGFCETHEQLFTPFESTGKITDGHQTVLQAFRTPCREIARKHHDVDYMKRATEHWRAARFNYFKNAILSAAPGIKIQQVTEKGNGVEEASIKMLAEGEDDLRELDELYDEFSGTSTPDIRSRAFTRWICVRTLLSTSPWRSRGLACCVTRTLPERNIERYV